MFMKLVKSLFIGLLSLNMIQGCDILSLSGGGSFGINEVAILDNLYDHSQIKDFDLVTGISAGGLNTGFLSYFPDLKEGLTQIKNVYFNLVDSDVYVNNELHILSTYALMDTTPLRTTINQTLTTLEKNKKGERAVIIGSTNIDREVLDIYQFNKYSFEDKINIMMATSAIPIAFPPIMLRGDYHVDGGMFSNEIILEAISYLPDCNEYNFLIVSAGRNHTTVQPGSLDTFWKYLGRLVTVIKDNYNDEISRVMELCSTKKLSFTICYPSSPELDKYSGLEFGNAKALYNLTYSSFECEKKVC